MKDLITVLESVGFECVYHDEAVCIYELLGFSRTPSIMRYYLYDSFYDLKSWIDGVLAHSLTSVDY